MEPVGDRITPLGDAERRFLIPISGTTVVKTKFPRSRIIRPDENRPTAHAPRTDTELEAQWKYMERRFTEMREEDTDEAFKTPQKIRDARLFRSAMDGGYSKKGGVGVVGMAAGQQCLSWLQNIVAYPQAK